jgi:UDP-N-acetylglucosamine:LPS N-acetylglucosamine transferase
LPGLTTAFEGFSAKVPVFFLPPCNYSQFLNLKKLKKSGAAPFSINWNNFSDGFDLKEGFNESEGVRKIMEQIEDFSESKERKEILFKRIEEFATSDSTKIIEKQLHFMNKLGGNGATAITKKIFSLI